MRVSLPPINDNLDLCCSRGNSRFKGRRVCADHLVELLAILEEDKGWHGANAELLCNVRELVDIDLVESDTGELLRVPDVER